MIIGDLKQRITIQRRSLSQSSSGETTETWTDLGTRWANVTPLTGREFQLAQQTNSEVTHKVTIRYTKDFTPTTTDRFIYNNRTFHIDSIINIDESNITYQIMAKEQV